MNKKSVFAGLAIVVLASGVLATWQLKSLVKDGEVVESPIVLPPLDPADIPVMPPGVLSADELSASEKELQANAKYLESMRVTFAKSFKIRSSKTSARDNNNVLLKIVLNKSYRDLSKLLAKESAVQLSKGNYKEAMDSRLDGLRLAVYVSNGGGLLDMLSAGAMETTAIQNSTAICEHLTGDQCLEYESEISKILTFRPTFANILENEKQSQLAKFRKVHGSSEWSQLLNPNSDTNSKPLFNQSQINQLKALSKKQIESNLIALYDALIAHSKLPYQQAKNKKIKVGVRLNPYSILLAREDSKPVHRYIFTQNTATLNLFRANLLNMARRNKTSKPFDFMKRLPDDPFGSSQLKTNGQKIYSIGSDGVDNQGAFVSQLVMDAKGDILPLY